MSNVNVQHLKRVKSNEFGCSSLLAGTAGNTSGGLECARGDESGEDCRLHRFNDEESERVGEPVWRWYGGRADNDDFEGAAGYRLKF